VPPGNITSAVATVRETWGTADSALVDVIAPSRAADERFRAWVGRSMRFTSGPDLFAANVRANLEADLRPLLPGHFVSHSGPAW
jgi:hypothetical protein